MTRFTSRWALVVAPLIAVAAISPAGAQQYFGRNKVQYEGFHWKILKSEHFDNFFYPAESLIVRDVGRMAERWYARHSDTFRHAFDRKSLIFYADHPDFEQTNVIGEQLSEETGGVTESNRTRVIMPFTGIYADNDHVLGHELVHVFQYNIAEGQPGGGLARLNALPLWLIEGMAEYFSLGRNDALTAMWMRDAVLRDKFPTIKQLTSDPRFFPYRYGQALWAYVGGRWGDRAIIDIYRTSLRLGWDQALIRVLGENSDSLSKDWAAANRAVYQPFMSGRTHPDSVGAKVVGLQRSGDFNVSPVLSPDGNLVAFFGLRNLFSIDLFVADAHTGKIIKKLAGPSSDPHFDAISFINSAGDWSPDASKFAFIVYAEGNNEVAILDTKSTDIERRIKLPGIGSVSSVSWSPDGHTLAIAGQAGGISDLYLLDLTAGTLRQLTNDRYADIQPSWSPDGKSIAFVTDRGPGTDFEALKYAPLGVGIIEVATGRINLLAPFTTGKAINPQWAPDGNDVFFISDQDGVPDVYRTTVASGRTSRVTKVKTGVSGITAISPALTVARGTGRMLFTSFYDQGHEIRALEASETQGQPVDVAAQGASAAALPPGNVTRSLVSGYLADATTGLPSGADFTVQPYHSSFSLDAIGQPSLGVVAGGPFGTGLVGGVSMIFGDQLSDRQLYTAIQANGTVKDIGGALQYYNMKQRWNYGLGVEHVPYLTGGVGVQPLNTGGYIVNYYLQRIYYDQAAFFSQYPFSSTRRFEFTASAVRLAFETQLQQFVYDQNGFLVDQSLQNTQSAYKPLAMFEPSVALVSDNSSGAFTSPVIGGRYRLSFTPTFGSLLYQTGLADYRKYFFMRPLSLAVRGYHLGRYGRDAENTSNALLPPMYLGEETWIRGYGWGSFTGDECGTSAEIQASGRCPAIERMFGSRVMVANAELRIPLFGTPEFGLLNVPFLPTEISPFIDAGLSYTQDQKPVLKFARTDDNIPAACAATPATQEEAQHVAYYGCAERIPVFSTGVSMRFNLFGYAIMEAYLAHPFQRPKKNWVWGFQLAPGW
jgi:dipeptidyl aminopeptidase/acylaminoacyl peptidase